MQPYTYYLIRLALQAATFKAANMDPPVELIGYCDVLRDTVPLQPGLPVQANIEETESDEGADENEAADGAGHLEEGTRQVATPEVASTRAARRERRAAATKQPVLEDTESEGDQGATDEEEFEYQPVLCLAEPAVREDGQKPTPFADRTNSKVRPLQAP